MRTLLKIFIEFITVLLLFYVLVFWPQGMWNLNSLTRDQTHKPCNGNAESQPLDHQRSPWTLSCVCWILCISFPLTRMSFLISLTKPSSSLMVLPALWNDFPSSFSQSQLLLSVFSLVLISGMIGYYQDYLFILSFSSRKKKFLRERMQRLFIVETLIPNKVLGT